MAPHSTAPRLALVGLLALALCAPAAGALDTQPFRRAFVPLPQVPTPPEAPILIVYVGFGLPATMASAHDQRFCATAGTTGGVQPQSMECWAHEWEPAEHSERDFTFLGELIVALNVAGERHCLVMIQEGHAPSIPCCSAFERIEARPCGIIPEPRGALPLP